MTPELTKAALFFSKSTNFNSLRLCCLRDLLFNLRAVPGELLRQAISCLQSTPAADTVPGMIATSYRYIVQRAGVRSGHPVVEGTRIGVHDVVAMIKTGASVDEIVASMPRLTRAQVYECLAYYEDHRSELDPLVAAQTAHLDE